MNTSVSRVYIHYPFCSTYCRYCNFAAGAPPREEFTTPYFKRLYEEIETSSSKLSSHIESLYFGGGTPSLMPVEHLEAIINFYSSKITADTEITIEINPENVTKEKSLSWKKLGINRVSLGWQSMEDTTLETLNRSGRSIHNKNAFSILRETGFDNISVDRILSVQGDEDDSFYQALEYYQPEHVSVYQLTIEKRTVLYEWARQGRYKAFSDEDAIYKEETCRKILAEMGYEHYEISNYAKNRKFGKHNLGYWNYDHYLGLGAGAAGFIPKNKWGIRTMNPFSFKDYVKGVVPEIEELSQEIAIKDALMLGIRKREGIIKSCFSSRLNIEWADIFVGELSSNFFEETAEKLILKPEALQLCNPAILNMWDNLKIKSK
ncbi:MAG: radical SAM family heme chaperone HemW [Brevinema sp.]